MTIAQDRLREATMPDWLRDLALAVGGCMEVGAAQPGPAGIRVISGEPREPLNVWWLQVSPGDGEPRVNLTRLLGVLDRTDEAFCLGRRAASLVMRGSKGDYPVLVTVHLDPAPDEGGDYLRLR
jgi:hypothetical protein